MSKQDKVRVTNLKKIAKNANFVILQVTAHGTYPLKLLDKIHKYKMDLTRTVGTTEQTQTDRRTEWNQYTPQQLRCAVGLLLQELEAGF